MREFFQVVIERCEGDCGSRLQNVHSGRILIIPFFFLEASLFPPSSPASVLFHSIILGLLCCDESGRFAPLLFPQELLLHGQKIHRGKTVLLLLPLSFSKSPFFFRIQRNMAKIPLSLPAKLNCCEIDRHSLSFPIFFVRNLFPLFKIFFQVLKGSFCVELQCALCSTPKRKHSSLTYLINVSSVHFQLKLAICRLASSFELHARRFEIMRSILFFGRCRFSAPKIEGWKKKKPSGGFFSSVFLICRRSQHLGAFGKKGIGMRFANWNEKIRC